MFSKRYESTELDLATCALAVLGQSPAVRLKPSLYNMFILS